MKSSYILRRVIWGVTTLFFVITLNFLLVRAMPGDPMIHILGEEEYYKIKAENPNLLQELSARYGMDEPLAAQYLKYIRNTFALDFGFSYVRHQGVTEMVLFRMIRTLLLAIPSLLISAVLGGVLGIWAGWFPSGKKIDRVLTPIFLFLNTIPANCLSILLIALLAFQLGWFPISGLTSGNLNGLAKLFDMLWHMALPLVILVTYRLSSNYIHMKSYMTKARDEEYVVTAVSKGLSDRKVLWRHLLKNVLPPYVTLLLMQTGHILSGAMMVELAFSWKGMGTLMQTSITSKDYPTLQLCFLVMCAFVILCNLLADIAQIAIDPRLRESGVHG